MAAPAAAARRAWSQTGVSRLGPFIGSLHREIHKTSLPAAWLRVKAPFSPHPHPLNGCHTLLLRPSIRCQSTAAVAGAQVVQPVVSPPIETSLAAGDLGQAVQELSLAELGLGSHTPVGLIQNFLESLHVDVGLPWWGAIVAGEENRMQLFPGREGIVDNLAGPLTPWCLWPWYCGREPVW
ncbi:mitochondrial inner membrane protein OXA1L-like, partial [Sceloporus undulatus]|uniref:mitochondrial inner membrane protein OXA1L-like n=1 Tax=Sceloporus undulatus TaxID=8520 RepID=UPI001C4DBF24